MVKNLDRSRGRHRPKVADVKPWPRILKVFCILMAHRNAVKSNKMGRMAIDSMTAMHYDDAKFFLSLSAKYEARRDKWHRRGGYNVLPS